MSKLSKNIIYNLFGQGLLLVLGFVAVKYVFKQLGEDALGIIYFTLTMNAVLCAVLEMGICSTTVREVSSHFQDEPAYIRDLIRTGSLFYWGAYVLLAVVIYFSAPILVEKWIRLKTMDVGTATHALQILGIASVVGLPQRFYASLFRGLQRMEFNNIIDAATNGLQQFGTVVILVLGGGLFQVVYWLAVCFALSILTYLFVSARFFSWRALIPGYSIVVTRRNLGFSLNMMSISILAMIHTQVDKVIVSKLLSIGTLGFYGFAWGVVSKATLLTGSVAQAAFPSLSALFKSGDRAAMMAQYRKLHDLICFATVPFFAAIPFAILPLFSYLFNRDVAQMLLLPITFLCVGYYMHGALHMPYYFSLAVGKPEISTRSNFYALFVVLPVTVLLVYFFGLPGAGFSWVFYHLFAYSYAIPRICSECLEMPVSEWYRHVLKIFALLGSTYGVAWVVVASVSAYTVQALGFAYIGASLAFLFGAYLMIGHELRETLLGVLHQISAKLVKVAYTVRGNA